MILIDNAGISDPTVNLALEEYCVRNLDMSNDYLLFYINKPSVIIGKHQNTVEEINSGYVNEKGIHVVRRISGGGAVYHDSGNLNFSFMTKYSNETIHNFNLFTQPVIKVLNELGIRAELNGRNDITVSGRKISGNAQFTDTKSMFSHGTLLFNSNLDDVVKALNVKIDKIESKGIKSVRSRVANIKEFLPGNMTIEDFKANLTASIFKNSDSLPVYGLSDSEWADVHKLSKSKYRTWDWNYGRSPDFNIRKIKRFGFGEIDIRIHVKNGLLTDCKIYGDFLGHGELTDIESRLKNARYEKESLKDSLINLDLKYYFGDITPDEFADLLTD